METLFLKAIARKVPYACSEKLTLTRTGTTYSHYSRCRSTRPVWVLDPIAWM